MMATLIRATPTGGAGVYGKRFDVDGAVIRAMAAGDSQCAENVKVNNRKKL